MNGWQEKLALARERGGPSATAFWLLRSLLRIDVYRVLAVEVSGPAPPLPAGWSLLRLSDGPAADALAPALLAQLDAASGCGAREVLRQGGRLYALVEAGQVAAQLRIDPERAAIDTPCEVLVDVGSRNTFLSFLFTAPARRRGGWARRLVQAVCADLAGSGAGHCVCHVQATNLRSLNTFAALGWRRVGNILVSAGGRHARYRGAAVPPVRLLPLPPSRR